MGAARETVEVSVRVLVLLTVMTAAGGVMVSVIVRRSMNWAVTVGARPWKEVVVALIRFVT